MQRVCALTAAPIMKHRGRKVGAISARNCLRSRSITVGSASDDVTHPDLERRGRQPCPIRLEQGIYRLSSRFIEQMLAKTGTMLVDIGRVSREIGQVSRDIGRVSLCFVRFLEKLDKFLEKLDKFLEILDEFPENWTRTKWYSSDNTLYLFNFPRYLSNISSCIGCLASRDEGSMRKLGFD